MTDARYLLDEHMPTALALGLRRLGIDAVTLAEVGRLGLSDTSQLQWALAEGRVIVTHDHDFIELGWSAHPNTGIAFCDEGKYQVGGLVRRVAELHSTMQTDDWADRVSFL